MIPENAIASAPTRTTSTGRLPRTAAGIPRFYRSGRGWNSTALRRHVLIPAQHVLRVVTALQRLEAVERLGAERRADALDRLVRLHVVDVAAPGVRPGCDRVGRLARPRDLLVVEGRVLPDRHRADIERGVAEADRCRAGVAVLRRAVQRLDQDSARGPAQRDQALEQRVDQLVRQLAHEMALPVVPVQAVRALDDALLLEKRPRPQAVRDEP